MTEGASIYVPALFLFRKSEWQLSNLKLQKILYFAQMISLGRFGQELIRDDFQAWPLGPVNATLYHACKIYGPDPVESLSNPFKGGRNLSEQEEELLNEILQVLGRKSISSLIGISHWKQGAWSKNYVAGEKYIVIPKEDMLEEYETRERLSIA